MNYIYTCRCLWKNKYELVGERVGWGTLHLYELVGEPYISMDWSGNV